MSDWFPDRGRQETSRKQGGLWSFGGPESVQNREKVVWMATLYGIGTFICAIAVVIALANIFTGQTGFIVMFLVFGIPGLIIGNFFRQYISDLRAQPIVIEGEVQKKWHKGNLMIFFFPSYYIYADRKVFSIRRDEYAMLLEGDLVRVTCFPHSLMVEKLERFDRTAKQFVPAASGAIQ
jgi:hypothetical protein